MNIMENNGLTNFEGNEIRKIWHDEEWYFSIVDVVTILSDTNNPNRYWTDLKRKIQKESQSYDFFVSMKLAGKDGRKRLTDCTNIDGLLRIVMSVPSPKAEPLRLWLAQTGRERIEETENPELGFERMKEIYKTKGYSDEWITRRMKTIEVRKELTDEWQKRGIKESKDFSILTATISKETFGITPSEHSKIKGLDKHNLRDHMTPLELILTALGEEVTRTITIKQDALGFNENHEAALKGGKIAGEARERVEIGTDEKIVSSQNFLHLNDKKTDSLPEGDSKG
jgi:DNA-damage-inducible protein D